jgi:hypothetical protein
MRLWGCFQVLCLEIEIFFIEPWQSQVSYPLLPVISLVDLILHCY